MTAPATALARCLSAAALGAVLLAGAAHAQENEVDAAVEATRDAAGNVVDALSGAADEVTSSATWDRIAGNWKQFSGSVQERWGELTDDEVAELDGNREQLVGKVQERYGITRMEAGEQVDDWADEQ